VERNTKEHKILRKSREKPRFARIPSARRVFTGESHRIVLNLWTDGSFERFAVANVLTLFVPRATVLGKRRVLAEGRGRNLL
jgi:hypothetical protein